MKRIRLFASSVSALLGVVAAFGCRQAGAPPSAEPSGLTEKQFVSVYVDLWRARTTATTPEEFEAQKKQILTRARVSERALQLFTREHADNISFMAAVWDSVQNRLNAPNGTHQPE